MRGFGLRELLGVLGNVVASGMPLLLILAFVICHLGRFVMRFWCF